MTEAPTEAPPTEAPVPSVARAPSLWVTVVVALGVSTAVFALGTWLFLLPRLDAHDQRLSDIEELVAEDEPLVDDADEPAPPHAALPPPADRE